jgi:hypothetical protein
MHRQVGSYMQPVSRRGSGERQAAKLGLRPPRGTDSRHSFAGLHDRRRRQLRCQVGILRDRLQKPAETEGRDEMRDEAAYRRPVPRP